MTIYSKLLELQKEVGEISRDKENPFFKSNYFDINGLLAELKPLFNQHGLVVIQPLVATLGHNSLETHVIEVETGEVLKSSISIPDTSDPQKLGSAITYLRRYSLQSLFLLQAQDDDGNAASNHVGVEKPMAGSDTAIVCEHGLAPKLARVKKAGPNQGREFYACGQPRDKQCNFFEWKDKAEMKPSVDIDDINAELQ